jgi:hypothetical protein
MDSSRFLLTASLLAALLHCCTTERAPTPPMEPLGPDSLAEHQSGTFGFYTATDRTERIRYIARWGDEKADSSSFVRAGDTIELSHAWSDTGLFEIVCRAQTEAGDLSDFSSSHPVLIRNSAPAAPAVFGPAQAKAGSEAEFSTVTTDPEGDVLTYTIAWGDGDTVAAPGYASGDTARMLHTWTAPGEYVVRSVAADGAGHRSAWSAPHAVVVVP